MKRVFQIVAVFVAMVAAQGWCGEITFESLRVGSRIYTNVLVLSANATDVYFSHAEGVANVKLRNLSPEAQKRLNYDPAAAAVAEERQALNDSLYQGALSSNIAAQAVRASKLPIETGEALFGEPLSDKSPLGKPAPDFRELKWQPALPNTTGKHVLIAFLSPGSEPGASNLKVLRDLGKRFASNLVLLEVRIAPGGANDEARNAAPPNLDDPSLNVSTRFGVTSVPTAVLISPNGNVVYHGHPATVDEARLAKLFGR